MAAYSAILTRLTSAVPAGKQKVIRDTAATGYGLQAAREDAAKRADLSPRGRAQLLEKHIKAEAGPALARTRRQLAHHQRALEKQRALVRALAIGNHDSLDAERRQVIREMPSVADRTRAVLSDPAFRGAALRGGAGLSGLPGEIIDQALEIATRENAPAESAALAAAEESQRLHDAMVRIFTREITETPFVVNENGTVRKIESSRELEQLLAELPIPNATILAIEERHADATVEL